MASFDGHSELQVRPIENFESQNQLPEFNRPGDFPEPCQLQQTQNLKGAESLGGIPQERERPERRNPFGLSPLVFGGLISLTTALIIGAVLGACLGTTLRGKDKGDTTLHQSSTSSLSTLESTPPSTLPAPTSTISSPTDSLSSGTGAILIDYVAPEPSLEGTD
ncbi:hypothetical protein F5B20DRAFT_584887 [Whalleya microplaca]|nr:hypothetical protein F5B20DRAFT_584887 [Whalleya microplaca]